MAFHMEKFGAPNITRFGEAALVLDIDRVTTLDMQRTLGRAAAALVPIAGVVDVVAGLGNLTLFYDPLLLAQASAREQLARAWSDAQRDAGDGTQVTVHIPVRYGGTDGPDLAEVAHACGLDGETFIERHLRGEYAVYVMGFAPGFPYLGGLDTALHVPRRAQPRTQVPAGSVAIAGAMTGIYPRESPGGWSIIGRTDLKLFDVQASPVALLSVGTRVRFTRQ
jgi:5-oxoprolinase (ATP-hydrolysing) subunit B